MGVPSQLTLPNHQVRAYRPYQSPVRSNPGIVSDPSVVEDFICFIDQHTRGEKGDKQYQGS
jgi:hypothetical protein